MTLRDEALLMLDKRGAVLETARRVSSLLSQHKISGAIIGGVSVVLHGHIRTTRDVDVWIEGPLSSFRPAIESIGGTFDADRKEFLLDSVPIHLVDENMVQPQPRQVVEIEEITTISLPDLLNLKLKSGLARISRAQDLADVIGLIKCHNLTGSYAGQIDKPLRPEFRKLVKAVASGR